jgi:hypothetical protein
MFEKRRAAKAKAQLDEELTRLAEEPPAEEPPAERFARRKRDVPAQEALTLSTMCACGHTRRDHRGLRIEVTGRCWECDCEEFRRASETPESREQMMERIRAALARVERLQETVVGLRAAQHPAGNGRRSRPG